MKMFPIPCFNRVEKIEKDVKLFNYWDDYSITISGKVDEYGNVEIFKPNDDNVQTEYTYVSDENIVNYYNCYNTVAVDSANWAE